MAVKKFLVAGLGNPGPAYELTRHNAGFYFLDAFAAKQGWSIGSLKFQGLYGQGRFDGSQILSVKPQTYMNRSGECVRIFLDYFDIDLTHLLVLHDDLDLEAGKVKIVRGGGAGGHNGIRSLIAHLGSQDFARLRFGIGRPASSLEGSRLSTEQFVLGNISSSERQEWEKKLELVIEAIELFVGKGLEFSMNHINGR